MTETIQSLQAENAVLRGRIAELEQHEAYLRMLFARINDVVLVLDRHGRFLDILSIDTSQLYRSPEELLGKTIDEFFPTDTAHSILDTVRYVLETGQIVTLEYKLEVLAGKRWFAGEMHPLDGQRVCCMLHNITARKQIEEALRASELRYRTMVENINDVIYAIDTQGYITYISPTIEQLSHYQVEEFIGQPFSRFVHPDDLPGLQASFHQTLDGRLHPYEFRVLDRSGHAHYVRTSSRLIVEEGQVTGLTGILTNLTEQKRAETVILESRTWLQNILDFSPAAIFVKDLKGRYIIVNRHTAGLLQKNMQEIIGKTNEELTVPSEMNHRWRAEDEWVLRNKQPLETEETFTRGGTTYTYLTTLFPIYNLHGDVSAVGGISTDISERKRTEEALHILQRAIEQSPSSIVITDTQGAIEYVNPQFTQVTGYTFDEVHGHNPRILKAGDRPIEFYQDLWDTITAGKQWHGEFHNRRKDGSLFWELASLSPIFDTEGNITHFLGVKEDITLRKYMEEALRQSEARYQLLAEQNARLYEDERRRVQELNALRTIMAEISGELDLNTLLQTILKHTSMLLSTSMAMLALYDDRRNDLVILACHGLPNSYINTRRALNQGAMGRAAATRQSVIVENYVTWEGRISNSILADAHTVLAVPLLAGEWLVGVISIADTYPQRVYTTEDEQLLRLLAQHATIAIRNAQLFETAQRRAAEAETLRQATAAVATNLNQQDAITSILNELHRVVPHDSASVQLLRGHESEIVGGRGFPDLQAVVGMRFPLNGDNPLQVVFRERRFRILDDAPQEYPIFRQPPHDHIRAWLGVPLVFQERIIGVLTLDSTLPQHFTPHHAYLVSAFADQVAIALEHARLFSEVQHLARIDALTGLYNRRHFFEMAYREIVRANRYRHAMSIIMLDIDNFKRVNDTFGHLAGDQVLHAVAQQCLVSMRSSDIVARYGGEEIIILVPETDLPGVQHAAERLRQHMETTPITTDSGPIRVTASIGIASYDGREHLDLETLIDRADQALYIAKSTRNQVCVWQRDLVLSPRSGSEV